MIASMYVARSLQSLTLPWLDTSLAPLIVFVKFANEEENVIAYKLTPMLYAALECQGDILDNRFLDGLITREVIDVAVDRLNRIRTHANKFLDAKCVLESRDVLANKQDALRWVLGEYEKLAGGRDEVIDLEGMAARCPFREPREVVGENKSSNGNDDGSSNSNNSGLADDAARQSPDTRLAG